MSGDVSNCGKVCGMCQQHLLRTHPVINYESLEKLYSTFYCTLCMKLVRYLVYVCIIVIIDFKRLKLAIWLIAKKLTRWFFYLSFSFFSPNVDTPANVIIWSFYSNNLRKIFSFDMCCNTSPTFTTSCCCAFSWYGRTSAMVGQFLVQYPNKSLFIFIYSYFSTRQVRFGISLLFWTSDMKFLNITYDIKQKDINLRTEFRKITYYIVLNLFSLDF